MPWKEAGFYLNDDGMTESCELGYSFDPDIEDVSFRNSPVSVPIFIILPLNRDSCGQPPLLRPRHGIWPEELQVENLTPAGLDDGEVVAYPEKSARQAERLMCRPPLTILQGSEHHNCGLSFTLLRSLDRLFEVSWFYS